MKHLFLSLSVVLLSFASIAADTAATPVTINTKPSADVIEASKPKAELFHAGEFQIDGIGYAKSSVPDEYTLGGGIAVNYFPWRAAGIGIEGRSSDTGSAFFDRLGACLIGRLPVEKLRIAPEFRVGFDHDMERNREDGETKATRRKRGFDVYASVGGEYRITKNVGLGVEVRGVRPVAGPQGEHVLGIVRARLAF
jgi:hypothetical protein